ncbi:uncharacterized protein LOC113874348 [Abrus precatorius]|uniref:Uncharacterized protein LOC113874348 n=1 Tax=Abrus precatorius TaxID=3816 RepID=A0A8B8MI33_ABRPR|nr:uncharacterized protein LOC113874348 [Abrus precatorius]
MGPGVGECHCQILNNGISWNSGIDQCMKYPPTPGSIALPTHMYGPCVRILIMSSIAFHPNDDDYIGTESCIDLQNQSDMVVGEHDTCKPHMQAKSKSNIKTKEKKVFPPPIPLLARTQNLASHMPWVLKRYYTNEGRLILKEEKVKHHEYFRAHRANGRLTLQLVPLDDYDECFRTSEGEQAPPPTSTIPNEKIHNDSVNVTHDNSIIDTNGFKDEGNVADEIFVENDNGVVVAGCNGRPKCLNCNSVRSTPSCIFGMPVHPIRTVHG